MTLYFADPHLVIIGEMGGRQILSAKRTEQVRTGRSSLLVEAHYPPGERDRFAEIAKPGNFVLTKGRDGAEFYCITTCTQSIAAGELEFYAEDVGLDVINQVTLPSTAASAMSIEQYIRATTPLFTIRINEAEGQRMTLSWDSESTVAARLASIATSFECEFQYSFEFAGLKLKTIYLDIYKRRGRNVARTLTVGREIAEIRISRSVENLATAIQASGNDDLTLVGEAYDDGDIVLMSQTGTLISRSASEEWTHRDSEALPANEIVKLYEVDTASKTTLLREAVRKLKSAREMSVSYDVSIAALPRDLRIGDAVAIVDPVSGFRAETRLVELTLEKTTGRTSAVFENLAEE